MTHPETGTSRTLFDCPQLQLTPGGPCVRLIVATHPATSTKKPSIGVLRGTTVFELFLTTAPQGAFTAADVLGLYLHRGSFETVLADEDQEQHTDRWVSHARFRTGMVADLKSMGLESPFGTRTTPLSRSHAPDGMCGGFGGGGSFGDGACSDSRACSVWSTTMGESRADGRIGGIGLCSSV